MIYNDPNGSLSSVDIGAPEGSQLNLFHYQRKAIIDIRNDMVFQQLADTSVLPKNYGKTIKKYHYIPVLDDRNNNDQGIDAAGSTIAVDLWGLMASDGTENATTYATKALAEAAAITNGAGEAAFLKSGALYGSSKDIGVITAKLPSLSESGGRVNRMGHSRITVEGSIENQGMFFDYTEDSVQFDTDKELLSHIMTETVVAANEMIEDNVQKDLLNNAGVIMYGGVATSNATITAEGADPSVLTYKDLVKLSIELDNNKCPKSTKFVAGSNYTDTRVVNNARFIYVGSEMLPTLMALEDFHGNAAWKSVESYADAGNVAAGEAGAIHQFRFIVVQEMMRWQGDGGAVTTNPGYMATGDHYDVIPMLVVGSGSFSTISFHTMGKTAKFSIIHKKPGVEVADAYNNPYGKLGFYSIQWWYGSLILRPEWIAVYKTIAEA